MGRVLQGLGARLVFGLLGLALIASAWSGSAFAAEQAWPRLTPQGDHFARDGQPYQVISGALHFQRIARADWDDRLRKARALGLNTVETYVFWNAVEPQPGQFDFTGNNDVAAFVRAAAAQGLSVILRVGPYACAEWEAGGYPGWLFADPAVKVRSRDPRYLAAAQRYLDAVGAQVKPLLNGHGGPIIAVQVENEYGSYDNDHAYMQAARAALVHAGLDATLLFTADGADMLANGTLPDTLAVVNFAPGEARSAFDKLAKFRPGQPRMAGEYWAGWFDHWGEPHAHTDAQQQADELAWMLGQGISVNLYMFTGGTSFGFMNGANFQGNPSDHYAPDTTGYDYDAVLDEAGRPTAKFALFRDVIAKATGVTPPALPKQALLQVIAPVTLAESTSLWDNLPTPIASDDPLPMEHYGQATGYILYRTQVQGPFRGDLYLGDVHDAARVYLDQRLAGSAERRLKQVSVVLDVSAGTHTLDVLVENSGRVNYGPHLADGRAGLLGTVLLDQTPLKGWQVYPLPMTTPDTLRGWTRGPVAGPAFHRGTLRIDTPADTYLDLRAFGRGFVWADRINLGRHWDLGPARALYWPGAWQRRGDNRVVVFDLDDVASPRVQGVRDPIWITPGAAP
ncbi:beta-galactosidase [Pseudoxanthomonas sp. GM95]|uniref:glycoside hydrolase family 35 protein n=1 Tax=Pseudoxanthomonas sp. GM95 TaxID=1881043 RepID=UPI0008AAEF64|nr:beta-galactosidase family protein [Pseudoxanthomonas sp. GM95]SEM37874.1 beta-galactosidase [Pseudoxanthomonas sp. GM95]